jgi:hypothetical protein
MGLGHPTSADGMSTGRDSPLAGCGGTAGCVPQCDGDGTLVTNGKVGEPGPHGAPSHCRAVVHGQECCTPVWRPRLLHIMQACVAAPHRDGLCRGAAATSEAWAGRDGARDTPVVTAACRATSGRGAQRSLTACSPEHCLDLLTGVPLADEWLTGTVFLERAPTSCIICTVRHA